MSLWGRFNRLFAKGLRRPVTVVQPVTPDPGASVPEASNRANAGRLVRPAPHRGSSLAGLNFDLSLPGPATSVPEAGTPANVERRVGRPVRPGLHPGLLSAGISFGLGLLRQLTRETSCDNLVISPVSIALTLAMATNGARGQTRDSMAKLLGVDKMEMEEWNEGYKEILQALRVRGEQVELWLSNSVWLDEHYLISPEFAGRCKTSYNADVVNISFDSADAATRINRWVSEQTGWKIREIIARTSSQDRLLLLNATYFRGRWERPFDSDETREETFHAESGPRSHPMMHQEGDYSYLETDEFQAVALSYGFYGMALYLFLPARSGSLSGLLEGVTAAKWEKWMASFRNRPGEVVVPRFRVECAMDLEGALRALGMTEPFEREQADFSGMSLRSSELFVAHFRHLTSLDVNELGSEAAAATGMTISFGIKPPPFLMVVDRPFLMAIRDQLSGLLLFMGSVLEP